MPLYQHTIKDLKMTVNFININYEANSASVGLNGMGMRDMQSRAFELRESQYILIKSPPASGKSRALMFLALEKMKNQGVLKTIVVVPEKSIGGSFSSSVLVDKGFHSNWSVLSHNNLCIESNETSEAFQSFMRSDDSIIVCTHSTLRNSFGKMKVSDFDNCLIAIDEFHHLSSNESNKLGAVLEKIMDETSAHVIAMTGSYFRGDTEAILKPVYEEKFDHITYNYYEQLNGYKYLKTLGIGYHFYQGSYLNEIPNVLDTDKKTILHIPNINSLESTKNKYGEVSEIIKSIGSVIETDQMKYPREHAAGIILVSRHKDSKIIKIADLVNDNQGDRDRVQGYLRDINHVDDIDLIIALGTAKEGFDWTYCEHALTIGNRGSLTEIVQILGRCTRDSPNKTHAQLTNLIINPDVSDNLINTSVNNMIKAIVSSLLMEQILEPKLKFRSSRSKDNAYFCQDYMDELDQIKRLKENKEQGYVEIKGFLEPSSDKVRKIIEERMFDIKEYVLKDDVMKKSMAGGVSASFANKHNLTRILMEFLNDPELSPRDIEEIRQHFVVEAVIKSSRIEKEKRKDGSSSSFIRMASGKFNLDDLSIDLIDKCNIYENTLEIMSKTVDKKVFRAIINEFDLKRVDMTIKEASEIFTAENIEKFMREKEREPSIRSSDIEERRLASAIVVMKNIYKKHKEYL